MPAAEPPHKLGRRITPIADRVALDDRLAIAGNDAFLELSTLEMERPGRATRSTASSELRRHSGDEDELVPAHGRRLAGRRSTAGGSPSGSSSSCEWVVGPRPGVAAPDRSALEGRFGATRAGSRCSTGRRSTCRPAPIRARVAAGSAIRYLVPRARRGGDRRSRPSIAGATTLSDTSATQTRLDDPADLAHRIVDIASDKKANDIVLLRTAEITTMADYFVICSGRSDRQVAALAGAISRRASQGRASARSASRAARARAGSCSTSAR